MCLTRLLPLSAQAYVLFFPIGSYMHVLTQLDSTVAPRPVLLACSFAHVHPVSLSIHGLRYSSPYILVTHTLPPRLGREACVPATVQTPSLEHLPLECTSSSRAIRFTSTSTSKLSQARDLDDSVPQSSPYSAHRAHKVAPFASARKSSKLTPAVLDVFSCIPASMSLRCTRAYSRLLPAMRADAVLSGLW